MTMSEEVPTEERRAELFLRGSVPAAARDPQSSLADRLERLAAADRLDAVETHTWPKRVPVDEARLRERYEAFTDWAAEADADLTPFFDTRECYSWSTGERYRALVLPLACLAVYEDGDLRAVYPHDDGETVRTVEDGVEALTDEPTLADQPLVGAAD